MRLFLPCLLSVLMMPGSAWAAGDSRSSTHLTRMSIELPSKEWQITANGLDEDKDPEFSAKWHEEVELSLGEVATLPLVTGEATVMLDAYEEALKPVFHVMDREKQLPTWLRPPDGFECRAYRSSLYAADRPDSTDLTCYAPYRGGARFLQVEIGDDASAKGRAALQSALDAIQLK